MQFSKGVEYALHCLIHLTDMQSGKSIGIKELAAYQGISETYLSKIFTKLRKSGLVNSVPGVNGGYTLAKPSENISFQDVIDAIEGSSPIFQCVEIRQNEIVLDKNDLPDEYTKCPCLIKTVMIEAEDKMRSYLRTKSLRWLSDSVRKKVPPDIKDATMAWFKK